MNRTRPAAFMPMLLLLLLTLPGLLAAQGNQGVTGMQGILFGDLLPGLPAQVLRTDPARSGQFELRGRRNGFVMLQFTLPAVMTGPGGASMPITFSGSDAGFSPQQSIGNQVAFDPRAVYVAQLTGAGGRAAVFLGATAQPAFNQAPGAYTGTITLTAFFL